MKLRDNEVNIVCENNIRNVYVLGEDNRSKKLREILIEDNEEYKIVDEVKEAEYIFCPIPFSKDNIKINNTDILVDNLINLAINGNCKYLMSGKICREIQNKLEKNNITVIDILNDEEYALKNAIATSEGAIKKAIEMTDITLLNSNVLILGFGRIGKALAHNLIGFDCNIYSAARRKEVVALINSLGYNGVDLKDIDNLLSKVDIIFNTIPSMVLDKEKVKLLNKNACVIDLASVPGGVDFEELYDLNINTCWYLGVPSKDSPKSAAIYIKETIDKILGEEDYGRKD